ncbi:hypothetical protein ACH3VR_11230 [Microbacterium sp. B2969]|uniref:Lipoprotein n=1 Tax=Microbacterium alkaliflavum TaxID=3248839 RepID=A0ABW7Q7V9_9MICO
MIRNSRMRSAAFVLALASTAILLAGCAAGPADAGGPPSTSTATSAPAAVVTPTSSATPSGPPADPEDPSTWIVTDGALGPFVIGEPFTDAVAALPSPVDRDPEVCTHAVFWQADPEGGSLVISRSWEGDDSSPLVEATWADWGIDEQHPAPAGPMTDDGLGVGSGLGEVLAQHPDAVPGDDHIASSHLQVGNVFFRYRPDSDIVSAVTVTDGSPPPGEYCG